VRLLRMVLGTFACCGLTPRSSGAPTACHAGHQALGLRPILLLLSSAPCRRRPLSSNVRPQNPAPTAYRRNTRTGPATVTPALRSGMPAADGALPPWVACVLRRDEHPKEASPPRPIRGRGTGGQSTSNGLPAGGRERQRRGGRTAPRAPALRAGTRTAAPDGPPARPPRQTPEYRRLPPAAPRMDAPSPMRLRQNEARFSPCWN